MTELTERTPEQELAWYIGWQDESLQKMKADAIEGAAKYGWDWLVRSASAPIVKQEAMLAVLRDAAARPIEQVVGRVIGQVRWEHNSTSPLSNGVASAERDGVIEALRTLKGLKLLTLDQLVAALAEVL